MKKATIRKMNAMLTAALLILSIMVIGFDTGLKTSVRWVRTEQERIRTAFPQRMIVDYIQVFHDN